MRHGHEARSDGGRGAAGRAPRGPARVPGVARGAEEAGLGGRQDPELRRVGLAQHDEAGALEADDELAVLGRDVVAGEECRALREADARVLGAEVLEEEGHAGEGAGEGGGGDALLEGGAAGEVVHRGHDRVEAGVHPLDARDGRVHQLDGRDLLAAYEIGLGCRIEAGVGTMAVGNTATCKT